MIQALGGDALATVAEQLGAIVKKRREVREGFLAQLTSVQSQAKKVQYMNARERGHNEPGRQGCAHSRGRPFSTGQGQVQITKVDTRARRLFAVYWAGCLGRGL